MACFDMIVVHEKSVVNGLEINVLTQTVIKQMIQYF